MGARHVTSSGRTGWPWEGWRRFVPQQPPSLWPSLRSEWRSELTSWPERLENKLGQPGSRPRRPIGLRRGAQIAAGPRTSRLKVPPRLAKKPSVPVPRQAASACQDGWRKKSRSVGSSGKSGATMSTSRRARSVTRAPTSCSSSGDRVGACAGGRRRRLPSASIVRLGRSESGDPLTTEHRGAPQTYSHLTNGDWRRIMFRDNPKFMAAGAFVAGGILVGGITFATLLPTEQDREAEARGSRLPNTQRSTRLCRRFPTSLQRSTSQRAIGSPLRTS